MELTKKTMILELAKEFKIKQGLKKSQWIFNQLSRMNKIEVSNMYERLIGKVTCKI